jgi:hypothetical protein
MTQNYTIFATYVLAPTGNTGYGYSEAIHCNYIRSINIETDNINIQEVLINFNTGTSFQFLSDNIANGTGFTANKIYAIIQKVLTNLTGVTKADPANWVMVDVTPQITGHVLGQPITAAELASVVFRIPLNVYGTYSAYTLTYLNYPKSVDVDPLANDALSFGDETYFLGNVTTDIHADVYTTDLSITLDLNEFNSSTNLTWDGLSSVAITEIGIYDANKNLVAIGKLNDPITKDSSITRTILFAVDF